MARPQELAQPALHIISRLVSDKSVSRDDLIAALEEIGSEVDGWLETLRDEEAETDHGR